MRTLGAFLGPVLPTTFAETPPSAVHVLVGQIIPEWRRQVLGHLERSPLVRRIVGTKKTPNFSGRATNATTGSGKRSPSCREQGLDVVHVEDRKEVLIAESDWPCRSLPASVNAKGGKLPPRGRMRWRTQIQTTDYRACNNPRCPFPLSHDGPASRWLIRFNASGYGTRDSNGPVTGDVRKAK